MKERKIEKKWNIKADVETFLICALLIRVRFFWHSCSPILERQRQKGTERAREKERETKSERERAREKDREDEWELPRPVRL